MVDAWVDASIQTGTATVAPAHGFATYAEELAHSNMIRYGRHLFAAVVQHMRNAVFAAQVQESELTLLPSAHVRSSLARKRCASSLL